MATELKVGDAAPDFSAPASDGSAFHLKSAVGQAPIVLYFYPKDDTPGCIKEACGLRDDFAAFRKFNARVYGVSFDSMESHRKFIEKYALPFTLISDTDKKVAKLYGASGALFAKRMTFLIDKTGHIAWINPAVTPAKHSSELQEALSRL